MTSSTLNYRAFRVYQHRIRKLQALQTMVWAQSRHYNSLLWLFDNELRYA